MIAPNITDAEPIQSRRDRGCEYDGLTGAFADACRSADRQYLAKRQPERPRAQPAESTKQAINFLLNINDADRLNRFIAEHPRTEARLILAYVKERRS